MRASLSPAKSSSTYTIALSRNPAAARSTPHPFPLLETGGSTQPRSYLGKVLGCPGIDRPPLLLDLARRCQRKDRRHNLLKSVSVDGRQCRFLLEKNEKAEDQRQLVLGCEREECRRLSPHHVEPGEPLPKVCSLIFIVHFQ